jgi:hypothetical protein
MPLRKARHFAGKKSKNCAGFHGLGEVEACILLEHKLIWLNVQLVEQGHAVWLGIRLGFL